MFLTVLADATNEADGLGTEAIITLTICVLLFGMMIPFFIWWIQKILSAVNQQTNFQKRQCDHMDATERHMAAVDQTLAQILEELKRRPLS